MSNGYRRGGSYTRNGRTFQRRGTSIKGPSPKAMAIGVAVGAAALFGTGSGATVAVATVGIAAIVCWKYRRPLGRALRPVVRKAKRQVSKSRKSKTSSKPSPCTCNGGAFRRDCGVFAHRGYAIMADE